MNNLPLTPGTLYTVAAPSGTGKTTLVKALVDSLSNMTVSISHTTRPKRPTEEHGTNYYFVEKTEFRDMIQQDDFLEYATVFNNFYGTSRHWVEAALKNGIDVVLEIDWQGCQQVKRFFPQCISIFIVPPSLPALSQRLVNRNEDTPEIIKQRFADVHETISHIEEFDYVVVNDDFDAALHDLQVIVEAGRLTERRQAVRLASLLNQLKIATKIE